MKASRKPVSTRHRRLAGALRLRATEPEKRLGHALRIRVPVEDSHFRRQVPIAGFVVDFCCHRARLIVELDGEQHGFDAARRRDATRTATLEAEGYKVLRFWNEEVWKNLESVVDTIFAAVAERVPPTET